jgi:hypothetical protein
MLKYSLFLFPFFSPFQKQSNDHKRVIHDALLDDPHSESRKRKQSDDEVAEILSYARPPLSEKPAPPTKKQRKMAAFAERAAVAEAAAKAEQAAKEAAEQAAKEAAEQAAKEAAEQAAKEAADLKKKKKKNGSGNTNTAELGTKVATTPKAAQPVIAVAAPVTPAVTPKDRKRKHEAASETPQYAAVEDAVAVKPTPVHVTPVPAVHVAAAAAAAAPVTPKSAKKAKKTAASNDAAGLGLPTATAPPTTPKAPKATSPAMTSQPSPQGTPPPPTSDPKTPTSGPKSALRRSSKRPPPVAVALTPMSVNRRVSWGEDEHKPFFKQTPPATVGQTEVRRGNPALLRKTKLHF